jgi:uncharacterized protein
VTNLPGLHVTLQDDILARLRAAAPSLSAHGVREIWIFGSVARGEARDGSDVDILVDLSAPVSLFDLVRLRRRLEGLLGRRVDLVTREGLEPELREEVMREAVHAA